MILNDRTRLTANATTNFWGEISPCEHLVQIYQNDVVFLDALEGFVYGGLTGGDSVVIIATPEHRAALDHRLDSRGVDIADAAQRDRYISLDAEQSLETFMVGDMPSDYRFHSFVNGVMRRASRSGARVRAFGEMVAVLWARDKIAATVHLEYLWHRFCKDNSLCLFCAYPKAGMKQHLTEAMDEILAAHSMVIAGESS